MARATFYFDLGSPYAYLAAERLQALLREPVDWRPVLLGGLFGLTGRSSWSLGDERRRSEGIAEVERRAQLYGLAPVRWPDPWPGDYLTAMRAATYASCVGRASEFALQAWRDEFQRGCDMGELANVLDAAERAGLDPADVRAAIGDARVRASLREATDAAHARGVFGVPTVAIGRELFWGDDRLGEAAARLAT
jgi:2-hydroxychromene-2-carboxylate isomerase